MLSWISITFSPVVFPERVNWFTCGSNLSANNAQRRQVGEPKVTENDPSISALENKSAWRIDGGKWIPVVGLVSCLLVIKDMVANNITSDIQHLIQPNSKKSMQSVKNFFLW